MVNRAKTPKSITKSNKKLFRSRLAAIELLIIEGVIFYFEIFLRTRLLLSLSSVRGPLDNPSLLAVNSIANTILLVAAIYTFVIIGIIIFYLLKFKTCDKSVKHLAFGGICMMMLAIIAYFCLLMSV